MGAASTHRRVRARAHAPNIEVARWARGAVNVLATALWALHAPSMHPACTQHAPSMHHMLRCHPSPHPRHARVHCICAAGLQATLQHPCVFCGRNSHHPGVVCVRLLSPLQVLSVCFHYQVRSGGALSPSTCCCLQASSCAVVPCQERSQDLSRLPYPILEVPV